MKTLLNPKKYLFAIFLLFSCSDNKKERLLDNEVVIGKQFHQMNLLQKEAGDFYKNEVRMEFLSTPRNTEYIQKYEDLSLLMDRMNEIDHFSSKMIMDIDALKLELLEDLKENTDFSERKDEKSVLWSQFDRHDHLLPIQLNLTAIKEKDNADLVEQKFTHRFRLWEKYVGFRIQLMNSLGTYTIGKQSYVMKAEEINNSHNQMDLLNKVGKMVRSKPINTEDEQVLIEIYMLLTKNEVDNDGFFWYDTQFKNAPVVVVLNRLSLLQYEILRARKIAFKHIFDNLIEKFLAQKSSVI